MPAPSGGFPEGIAQHHVERPTPRWVRPLLLWVLVVLPVVLGASGLFGGGFSPRRAAASTAAKLTVETPSAIRSGNWFETRIEVLPRGPLADLVVAIDDPLWRRMSIDTFEPQAESGEYEGGAFRYHFGPAKAGEPLVIKIDGQIQSWGLRRLHGRYRLLDGDRELASVPITMTVFP